MNAYPCCSLGWQTRFECKLPVVVVVVRESRTCRSTSYTQRLFKTKGRHASVVPEAFSIAGIFLIYANTHVDFLRAFISQS